MKHIRIRAQVDCYALEDVAGIMERLHAAILSVGPHTRFVIDGDSLRISAEEVVNEGRLE